MKTITAKPVPTALRRVKPKMRGKTGTMKAPPPYLSSPRLLL